MADKITVGNVEIMAVMDMVPPARPPEAMFPEVPREAWGPYEDTLENGQFQLYYCCFVLRSKGTTIMVDTGMGPGPHVERGNLTGNLDQEIRPLLLAPDQLGNNNVSAFDEVNIVAHSHLHADHVGWNMITEGGKSRPTFPNARYLCPKADFDFFTSEASLEQFLYIKEQVLPLVELGLVDYIEPEADITSELRVWSTPGHTPGHVSILINSAGEKGVILGDVAHTPAQAHETDWNPGFDIVQDQSRATRHTVFDRIEREGLTVAAGHFPSPSFGTLVRVEGRRIWQPL